MYTYTHPQCVSYTHSKTETLNTNKHKKVHVWGTTLTSWTSPLGWIETLSASWFKLASEMQNSTAFQKITSSGLHNTVCACLQFWSVLLGIHLCCYWNEMVNKDVKASFLNTCLVTEPVIKFEQFILMLAAGHWTWKIKMKKWQCRRSLSVSLGVASLWLDSSWSRCWEGPTIFGQANSCAHCCQDEDDEDDDNDDDDDHHHDHDGK